MLSLFVGVTLYSQETISFSQQTAGDVRIAYINRADIFNSFPQVAAVEKELKQLELNYETEFVAMSK